MAKTNAEMTREVKAALKATGVPSRGVTVRNLRNGGDGRRFVMSVTIKQGGIRHQDIAKVLRGFPQVKAHIKHDYLMYYKHSALIRDWLYTIELDEIAKVPETLYPCGHLWVANESGGLSKDCSEYPKYILMDGIGEIIVDCSMMQVIADEIACMAIEHS